MTCVALFAAVKSVSAQIASTVKSSPGSKSPAATGQSDSSQCKLCRTPTPAGAGSHPDFVPGAAFLLVLAACCRRREGRGKGLVDALTGASNRWGKMPVTTCAADYLQKVRPLVDFAMTSGPIGCSGQR